MCPNLFTPVEVCDTLLRGVLVARKCYFMERKEFDVTVHRGSMA